jgi:hypothetical protein
MKKWLSIITNEPIINSVEARLIAPVPLAPFMGKAFSTVNL